MGSLFAPFCDPLGESAECGNLIERVRRAFDYCHVDEGPIVHSAGAVAQAIRVGRRQLRIDRSYKPKVLVQGFRLDAVSNHHCPAHGFARILLFRDS
jgi:hypothetical protein